MPKAAPTSYVPSRLSDFEPSTYSLSVIPHRSLLIFANQGDEGPKAPVPGPTIDSDRSPAAVLERRRRKSVHSAIQSKFSRPFNRNTLDPSSCAGYAERRLIMKNMLEDTHPVTDLKDIAGPRVQKWSCESDNACVVRTRLPFYLPAALSCDIIASCFCYRCYFCCYFCCGWEDAAHLNASQWTAHWPRCCRWNLNQEHPAGSCLAGSLEVPPRCPLQ